MTAGDGISRSSARREADMADMARAVEPVQAGQAEAPGGDHQIRIPRGQTVALCCSGGGIRSATFNLGVIQALQSAEVFGAVRTVTAVSGGSYLAAAHALVTANPAEPGSGQPAAGPAAEAAARRPAAVGEPLSPDAYALRSPEELHLRDHTRYLLETWQVAVRGIIVLIRGVLVNGLLAGSVIFVAAHVAGWLVGPQQIGILTGLQTGSPKVDLRLWWLIPALAAAVTACLAWRLARPARQPSWRSGFLYRARSAVARWWRDDNGRLRREIRQVLARRPGLPSNLALLITIVTAFTLVIAPLAIKGLFTVSLGSGNWSVITRYLGFSSAKACQVAVSAHPDHPICGAAPSAMTIARQNGAGASSLGVKLASYGSLAAAVVALARATLGRLRTYQADLSRSGPLASAAARVGTFLQRRLVPWIGSGLIVGAMVILALRWTAESASRPLLAGGWQSQGAQSAYVVLAFLLVKALTDINSTSMHAFYRDRLAAAYGVVRRSGPRGPRVQDLPSARLSMLRRPGQPTLVICAAANCTASGDLPPGRGSVSFTFTPEDVGLSRGMAHSDRAPTVGYEDASRLTLFDAVAVSGAAVSPVMGKMTRPALRILLAAADVRLGVWLPSPGQVREKSQRAGPRPGEPPGFWRRAGSALRRRWRQPDLRHLWAEAVGSLHLDARWLYVTDGGHYENLGMVEALRRRPDHLIVVDAAGEPPGRFSILGQAIALARSELRVQVTIDPAPDLTPDPASGMCENAYATGTFRYPEEGTAAGPHHLVYLKLAVPKGAPLDVIAYRQGHPAFPTDSTLQQLYDDQEFEAYRELGYHCAQAAVADICYQRPGPPGTPSRPSPAAAGEIRSPAT